MGLHIPIKLKGVPPPPHLSEIVMHNGLGHPRLKPSYIVSNRMVLVAMEVNSYFGIKYKN